MRTAQVTMEKSLHRMLHLPPAANLPEHGGGAVGGCQVSAAEVTESVSALELECQLSASFKVATIFIFYF